MDNYVICDLDNYTILSQALYKKPGVWAMYGKKENCENEWECLQVASTKNIASEIMSDIKFMMNPVEPTLETKPYINQFAEECFKYEEYSSARYQLYKHIKDEYKYIVFILVSDKGDIQERKRIESEFAWGAHAKYWRNGGSFKTEREEYYKMNFNEEELSEDVIECLDEIKKQLAIKQ